MFLEKLLWTSYIEKNSVVLLGLDVKSPSPASLQAPFRSWKATIRSPQSLLFSRPSSLSLCSHRGGTPALWSSLWPSFRTCTINSTSLLCWGLQNCTQVGSHESRAEGQNHPLPPAGHTSLDATLDATLDANTSDVVGILRCKLFTFDFYLSKFLILCPRCLQTSSECHQQEEQRNLAAVHVVTGQTNCYLSSN